MASPHTHEILIVEDDPSLRYLEAMAFDRRGMRAMVAEDGREALRLLETRDFCAIVLDLVMPKVGGYMVIKYVVEHKDTIPIVVVTGLKPEDLSAVDRRVVKQILFKPIELDKLLNDVRALCDEEARTGPNAPKPAGKRRRTVNSGASRAKKPRVTRAK
jgi:DNA-binding response OmpR family regulator